MLADGCGFQDNVASLHALSTPESVKMRMMHGDASQSTLCWLEAKHLPPAQSTTSKMSGSAGNNDQNTNRTPLAPGASSKMQQ